MIWGANKHNFKLLLHFSFFFMYSIINIMYSGSPNSLFLSGGHSYVCIYTNKRILSFSNLLA